MTRLIIRLNAALPLDLRGHPALLDLARALEVDEEVHEADAEADGPEQHPGAAEVTGTGMGRPMNAAMTTMKKANDATAVICMKRG